jgi:hypothetical protein
MMVTWGGTPKTANFSQMSRMDRTIVGDFPEENVQPTFTKLVIKVFAVKVL